MTTRPSVEELETALDIPQPFSDTLYLENSRRLTGPGLLWDRPGAIAEVVALGVELERVEAVWARQARALLDAVGWRGEAFCSRPHEGGLNLAISAPVDQLYSAIFVVEAAWHYTACELLGEAPQLPPELVTDIRQVMKREANPPLIALQQAAAEHGVDFISDDDKLSLGHGCGSQTWPVDRLPAPEAVDWEQLHDVPVAMITGTNGKSTCVRLAAAIATAAGRVAGITSTDFVRVGDEILDRGDYSGPGGARMLLRDPRLEMAFLEVARGGILRRGLPLRRAQAALVTNVAADHLGQYGINTVPALTEAKFSVFRTLAPGGVIVLNADDQGLVQQAHKLAEEVAEQGKTVSWFSLERENPCIARALADGDPCSWLEGDILCCFDGRETHQLMPVGEVPITMSGAARYNVHNALGVIGLAMAFELDLDSVRAGLAQFTNSPEGNPGRGNEFRVKGARVFVDFAHNPHSIAAVVETMLALPATRRLVMLGHAGDRSDEDIRALTFGALQLAPDHVIISEIPDYLRGRESGEISEIIRRECLRAGLRGEQLSFSENPLEGAQQALRLMRSDDLVLLLVHSHRDAIIELLQTCSGSE